MLLIKQNYYMKKCKDKGDKKVKILIVRLFPNEININNYNVQEIGLAKALVKKGHQCDIVLYTKGKERQETIEVKDKKSITIFWMRGINFLKNGLYSNKIIYLSKNYDIVQSSEYDQLYNIKLRRKINKKLIIYHGPYYDKFNKEYNLKCNIFDMLFLSNEYKNVKFITKSELATNFLKEKGFKDVTTIGVGLDKDKFINNVPNKDIINKLKDNKKYLLYIGKIEKRRNTLFLIKLLKNISMKNEDVKLVLIGNGTKKYVQKVFNYAKELNVYDKIIYFNKIVQNEISTLYKKCDIFVLPTEYEIFGMVMLEAMYFGLPVITTLNGGSSTVIEDGKDGYICNNSDVKEWTNKIEYLFNNKEKYNSISKKATQKIVNHYIWDSIANKFIKIYQKLLKE